MRGPEGFFCGLKVTWVSCSSPYILTCVLGTFPILGSRNLDERELESSIAPQGINCEWISMWSKSDVGFHVGPVFCHVRYPGFTGSRETENGMELGNSSTDLNCELC